MFFSSVYQSWEGVQQHKYREMRRLLPDFFSSIPEKLILDIGCGFGSFEKFLLENGIRTDKIIGIDTDPKALSRGFSVLVADGSRMPFKPGTFDAVIAIDSLHLIDGRDFERVLKNDGIVLCALFFNSYNREEKQEFVREKLRNFSILADFELHSQENEYVVLAQKR